MRSPYGRGNNRKARKARKLASGRVQALLGTASNVIDIGAYQCLDFVYARPQARPWPAPGYVIFNSDARRCEFHPFPENTGKLIRDAIRKSLNGRDITAFLGEKERET